MDTGNPVSKEITEIYGGRVRLRVSGICFSGNRLLLVNHYKLYQHDFWAPPGGGVEFSVPLKENLIREFQEECRLQIEVKEFLFGTEFLSPPLHAVELFFAVDPVNGSPVVGDDPELSMITDVAYMSWDEISSLPRENTHGIFKDLKDLKDLNQIKGFYRI